MARERAVNCLECKVEYKYTHGKDPAFMKNRCSMSCNAKAALEKIKMNEIKKASLHYQSVIHPNKKRTPKNEKKSNSQLLKAAEKNTKKVVHEFIRERDKFDLCICCNKPMGENYQAGHFWESGNNPSIRYDENNIHGQRADCNMYNGGDSGEYTPNLIKKIGQQAVDDLDKKRHEKVTYTIESLSDIRVLFREKLRLIL
ncbi:MAG: hypothetical protein ACJAYB_000075 [Psychromonas sp.]|jgi:hypothetical protein